MRNDKQSDAASKNRTRRRKVSQWAAASIDGLFRQHNHLDSRLALVDIHHVLVPNVAAQLAASRISTWPVLWVPRRL